MTRFGLGVWVLAKTGNAAAYTAMIFFAVFPAGIGALFAGPFIDRWNRRKIFIGANLIASLSILTMAIFYFTGMLQIWHLYITLGINGIATSFISPTLQSSTRLLPPKDKLTRASGLTQMLRPLETILSPSLAGCAFGPNWLPVSAEKIESFSELVLGGQMLVSIQTYRRF